MISRDEEKVIYVFLVMNETQTNRDMLQPFEKLCCSQLSNGEMNYEICGYESKNSRFLHCFVSKHREPLGYIIYTMNENLEMTLYKNRLECESENVEHVCRFLRQVVRATLQLQTRPLGFRAPFNPFEEQKMVNFVGQPINTNLEDFNQWTPISSQCEESIFCLRYGGIQPGIRLEINRRLGLPHSNVDPLTQLSIWSSKSIKETKKGKKKDDDVPFICRLHALNHVVESKNQKWLSATLNMLEENRKFKDSDVAYKFKKRLTNLVDRVAEFGSLKVLQKLAYSTLTHTYPPLYGGEHSFAASTRAVYFLASNSDRQHIKIHKLKILLDVKAVVRPESVYTACRNGQVEMVLMLLSAGVRCNLLEALSCGWYNNHAHLCVRLFAWIQQAAQLGSIIIPEMYLGMKKAKKFERISDFKDHCKEINERFQDKLEFPFPMEEECVIDDQEEDERESQEIDLLHQFMLNLKYQKFFY